MKTDQQKNSFNQATQFLIEHMRLTQKFTRSADGALSVHGISLTEYLIMYALSRAPSQTMRRIELAEAVGITASGVTRLLAPMEKIKLVEKEVNPRDARVSLVRLSTTGIEIFGDASVSFSDLCGALTQSLSTAELTKLSAINAKL